MSNRSRTNQRRVRRGQVARVKAGGGGTYILPCLGSRPADGPVDAAALAAEVEHLRVAGADCRSGMRRPRPARRPPPPPGHASILPDAREF